MRKLLASVAISALAAPALALAATASSQNADGAAPGGPERAITLRAKQRKAQLRRERRRAKKRAQHRDAASAGGAGTSTASPALQRIAACESGGNPSAIGGGGTFRGKYQFTYATWASVGGSGDPAAAPEAEQDRRAAMLYARSGPSQWPVCGR